MHDRVTIGMGPRIRNGIGVTRAARRLFIWAGLQSECYPGMAFHLLGVKLEPIRRAQPDCTADGCQEVIPLVKEVTMYC